MRSTVTEIDPKDGLSVPPSPRPGESITAAATRITKKQIQRSTRGMTSSEWQADAWDMYDLVGEQHFLANTLAGRMGQAKFFVGRLPEKATEEIEEVTSGDAYEVFQALDVNGVTSSQKIVKMALNLFMAGDCYLLGAPPESGEASGHEDYTAQITPDLSLGEVDLDTLEWGVHSSDEIAFDSSVGRVRIDRGAGLESAEYDPDEVFLIRIWRAHPRWAHQADSATRACLPILRELVGLTMQISAQVDSRLAGAGLFLIPESADRAARSRANLADEDPSPFATALMDAMITPISDRSSASAVVPLTVVVPDDSVEKFKHLQFSTPLDSESRSLRDEAIRRLALSQDCPPEILLGVGCVDDQTQALTRRGWVLGSELQVGDEVLTLDHETGVSEWKPVQAMNRFQVTDHEMLRLEGKGHSSLTTMNHRWPVIDANTGERKIMMSEELNTSHRILTAAPAAPRQAVYSDSFVELVGWFWTEGSYTEGTPDRSAEAYTDSLGRHYSKGHPGRSGKWGQACIAQSSSKNPERVARIRAALETEFGQSWGTESRQAGEWGSDIVRFNLNKHVYEALAGAGGKVPTFEFVQSLTPAQLELFIDVSCQGDGWHYGQGRLDIWQRDREPLEAYALALTLSGRMVTWTKCAGGYVVSDWRGKSTVRPIKAGMNSVELYTGEVWCPTVENGTWLARREGSVWFTGNSMNHWGAWLVREDVVVTHLEPPLALICDALTSQFLCPVLEQMGVADARQYVVWYDVSHMILRPDRSGNAKDLHAVGAISDTSLRQSMGFDEADAPQEPDKTDPAIQTVLAMVTSSPSLAQDPGLPALLEQVRAMYNDDESPAPTPQQGDSGSPAGESPDSTDGEADSGPPETDSGDSAGSEPPALTASVPSNPAAVAVLKGLRSISRSATGDESDSNDDA